MARTDYEIVNDLWREAKVGWADRRLSMPEAKRMARVLWKIAGREIKDPVIRPVWLREGVRRLVHDISHRAWRRVRPSGERRDHCTLHASWERNFTEEAIKRGWHVAPKVRPVREKKPAPDKNLVKLTRAEEAAKRWRTKLKRATTGLKKVERTLRRLKRVYHGTPSERTLGSPQPGLHS